MGTLPLRHHGAGRTFNVWEHKILSNTVQPVHRGCANMANEANEQQVVERLLERLIAATHPLVHVPQNVPQYFLTSAK